MNPALLEALKEFARVAILAILSAAVAALLGFVDAGQAVNWEVVGVVAFGAFLRAVDKFLHEHGVSTPLDLG